MNENTFNIVGYLKKDFQTNATVVIPILAKEYAAIVKKWPYPASLFSSFQHRFKQLDSCQWLDSNGGRLLSEATAVPTASQPFEKSPSVLWLGSVKIRLFGNIW